MSLRNLRSFLEVYRSRSISKASRNLDLTQPAVSQHIASLETQFGRSLFERQARGVEPTAFAVELAVQVGDGLDRAEAALSTMKARSTVLSGTVHVAGPSEFMAEQAAFRLKPLQTSGLQVRVHLGGKASLYNMLLDGKVDVAFTASAPKDERLASKRVGSEVLLAVAAPDMADRIAKAADLENALQAEPFVAYDMDKPLIRDWCQMNNLDIGGELPAMTAPDIRLLRAFVVAGIGWSVIPDYLCEKSIKSGALELISAPQSAPSNAFYLVWVKSALRHPRVAFTRDILINAW